MSGKGDPPRWLLIAVGVVLAAALAFAIGRFTAFDTSATPATPGTTTADAGFARDMQVHHAQAVEMATIVYRSTEDDLLRTLALDIATGQSAQIGQMYEWLVQWDLPQVGEPMTWMAGSDAHAGHDSAPLSDDEMRAAMGMATDAQLEALRTAAERPGGGDCLFLELMIRHHEGAIDMVDAVLERGSEPRVRQVATAMKQTQSAEITALQSMQSSCG